MTRAIALGVLVACSRADAPAVPTPAPVAVIVDQPIDVEVGRSRVSIATIEARSDTTLVADEVRRKVAAAYLAGIQHCHRQALARDPNLRGELRIALQVSATGRASGTVTFVDATVARCASGLVGSWRFPIPQRAGEPDRAEFEIVLEVAPG